MSSGQDDYHDLMAQKRFLGEIEQGIRFANREIIHNLLPTIDRERILSLSVAVGRLRARYLEEAFKLGAQDHAEPPDQTHINELKMRREMYEEARAAFEALREAIEKGYLDVDGMADNAG